MHAGALIDRHTGRMVTPGHTAQAGESDETAGLRRFLRPEAAQARLPRRSGRRLRSTRLSGAERTRRHGSPS